MIPLGDGVAYMAHIGGMVFGAATARLFESGQRQTSNPSWGE